METLYCVAPYRGYLNHQLVVGVPGHSYEFSETDAEWLVRDSPGSWHKSESQTFKRLAKEGTQNRMVDKATVADRMDDQSEVMSSGNFGAVKE